jgi:hypothetical protein
MATALQRDGWLITPWPTPTVICGEGPRKVPTRFRSVVPVTWMALARTLYRRVSAYPVEVESWRRGEEVVLAFPECACSGWVHSRALGPDCLEGMT